MFRTRLFALLTLTLPLFFLWPPPSLLLEGMIFTDDGAPLAGASIRLQGSVLCTRSDSEGKFKLTPGASRITATKSGYRIGWASSSSKPLSIKLTPLPAEDNEDYSWIAPGPNSKKPNNCANCHAEIHREWSASAHARSARNPKLIAFLYGTDGKLPPRRDWNMQAEHPAGIGVCATCHAPTFRDPVLEYDFRTIKDVAAQGVHCDYCHKIAEAPTDKLGIRFGRDGYPLLRPKDGELHNFGPLDDAVRPGESFAHAPFYKESRYCASCHEGVLFGVHVYGTYSEWLDSPAAKAGIQCQGCHMTPSGTMTNMAPGKGGIERDPKTLTSHVLPGGTAQMLRQCLKLGLKLERSDRDVRVDAELRAEGVGHRVPTGFIDRHLILVVEARDAAGNPLQVLDGPKLDRAAGPALAGKAGWIYAKKLRAGEQSPSPFWIPPDELSDTRLTPGVPDNKTFLFPPNAAFVQGHLLYRRFWDVSVQRRQWLDNEVHILTAFSE